MSVTRMFTALLACSLILAAASPAGAGSFGVRVRGGFEHVGYGDFNDWVDNVNDVVFPESGIAESVDNIGWIPAFQAEVVTGIIPGFELGVGAGIIRGKSELNISYGGVAGLEFEHAVTSFPFTATAYWYPPLPVMKPFVFAGAGAYLTKLRFEEYIYGGEDNIDFEADLDKWGFGLHGGAGISFALVPMVSLELGVQGRWCTMKGFEGTATDNTTGEEEDVFLAKEGKVLFGPESISEKGEYEEAEVDLSGVGFTIALKIAL